jgi:hypothetical protein
MIEIFFFAVLSVLSKLLLNGENFKHIETFVTESWSSADERPLYLYIVSVAKGLWVQTSLNIAAVGLLKSINSQECK